MFKWPVLESIRSNGRGFTLTFILLVNVFTWSFMILKVMNSLLFDISVLYAFRSIFYIAAIGASISGSVLSDKINRLHLLYGWMVFGLFSSLPLAFASNAAALHLSIMFIVLGISFGIGMPSCLAYMADHTSVDNRGRASAVIFVAANLTVVPFALLFTLFDPTVNAIILTAWRGIGLLIFILLKPFEEKTRETATPRSFVKVCQDRPFLLYLFPWFMFNLIDIFERPILNTTFGPEVIQFSTMVEPLAAVFSIILGGLLADRIGRKRVVIYGFVSLGIAYAIIGIATNNPISWYFYLLIDGIAYGVLWLTFLLILWGDLSEQGGREKYYVIGSSPFLIAPILPMVMEPLSTLVQPEAVFSIASFFLFLAVIPLMYAPETLPEKKIELRRLKGYVEAAKKLREKSKIKKS